MRQQSVSFVHSFRDEHHRQPTNSEIARHLDVSTKEWQDIKLAYQNRNPLSLDISINNDLDSQTSLCDLVADPNTPQLSFSL